MKKRILKKTKIIATIGPASCGERVLKTMFRSGMNIVRMNFSHGDYHTHESTMKNVVAAAKHVDVPAVILQDLAGPKIRTGDLYKEKITLRKGRVVVLTARECVGDENRLFVNYAKLPREVKRGVTILLNDGKIKLRVLSIAGSEVRCKVVEGGEIKGRRGINIPDVSLSISSLTEKDKKDVKFGIQHEVDFMALSFVRKASDILELKDILEKAHADIGVIAKIETRDAIENIDAIIAEADGIMVARGDLAVEVPPEDVPLLQKMIIRKCNRVGKPVIIATQMLESMIHSRVPTRAEVSDVANSILDGADAVMLSEETAMGEHPTETVRMMAAVAMKIESGYPHHEALPIVHKKEKTDDKMDVVDAISRYVVSTAYDINARSIVALTESGFTARMISRYRAQQLIVVMSPNERTLKRSMLSFGCYPVKIKAFKYVGEAAERVRRTVEREGFAKKKDTIVISAGVPFGKFGSTNTIMVREV